MYCRQCGCEMNEGQDYCIKCGFAKGKGSSFCPTCGVEVLPEQDVCVNCGMSLAKNFKNQPTTSTKSKLLAGLLQILLPFGIGRFYLGYTAIGVLQILVAIFTCGVGVLWSLIDGIMILCGKVNDPEGLPLDD